MQQACDSAAAEAQNGKYLISNAKSIEIGRLAMGETLFGHRQNRIVQ